MAAGEDQPQAVVRDAVILQSVAGILLFALLESENLVETTGEARIAAHPIDRLVPRRADNPRARVARRSFARPLFERGGEGLLRHVFGKLEIADQSDQRGQDSAEFLAVEPLYAALAHAGAVKRELIRLDGAGPASHRPDWPDF